jgi:hypothetical protein
LIVTAACTRVQDGKPSGPGQQTKTEKEQRVEKYNDLFAKALTICNGNDGYDDIWQSAGYLNIQCKNGLKIQLSLSY